MSHWPPIVLVQYEVGGGGGGTSAGGSCCCCGIPLNDPKHNEHDDFQMTNKNAVVATAAFMSVL
jgi:hypothetical protein